MRSTIGGPLDLAALSALTDETRMRHFRLLTRDTQAAAIRRLAATGMTDYGISRATQLSVEFIRHVIGEHRSSIHRERLP